MRSEEEYIEELRKQYRKDAVMAARENEKRISQINQEARDHGMTYGKYVAQMYLESKKNSKGARKRDKKRATKL